MSFPPKMQYLKPNTAGLIQLSLQYSCLNPLILIWVFP